MQSVRRIFIFMAWWIEESDKTRAAKKKKKDCKVLLGNLIWSPGWWFIGWSHASEICWSLQSDIFQWALCGDVVVDEGKFHIDIRTWTFLELLRSGHTTTGLWHLRLEYMFVENVWPVFSLLFLHRNPFLWCWRLWTLIMTRQKQVKKHTHTHTVTNIHFHASNLQFQGPTLYIFVEQFFPHHHEGLVLFQRLFCHLNDKRRMWDLHKRNNRKFGQMFPNSQPQQEKFSFENVFPLSSNCSGRFCSFVTFNQICQREKRRGYFAVFSPVLALRGTALLLSPGKRCLFFHQGKQQSLFTSAVVWHGKISFFFSLPLCLWSHKVRGSFTLSFSFPALSPPNLPKLHDRGPELHTIKAYNTHVNTHRDVDRCSYAFLIPVVPQSSLSCLHPLPPSERGPQWCPEDAWDHGGVNDTSFSSSFCLCLSSFSISPSSVSCSTIIRFHLHFMQFFSWSSLKSFACNLKPCSSLLAQPDPDTGVLQQERRIYQSADLSSC